MTIDQIDDLWEVVSLAREEILSIAAQEPEGQEIADELLRIEKRLNMMEPD